MKGKKIKNHEHSLANNAHCNLRYYVCVFLRDGDRARAVPVAKLGKTEGKIRIYSTELKAGAELLMPSAGEKIGNGDRIAVVH